MKEEEIRPRQLLNRYLELVQLDNERLFKDRAAFVDIACPACDSLSRQAVMLKENFSYQLCDRCKSLYLSPRPPLEMLNDYYATAESVKFWSTHFYRQTVENRRRKMIIPRARLVASLAAEHPEILSSCFMDIGCGYGLLLEEIRKMDLFSKIIGIEPAADLAEICRQRGFDVIEKNMEDVAEGELRAVMSTAFEVIEHLFSPHAFLLAVGRVLEGQGLFLFTTLTTNGFDIQVLWEHSKSVYPPHHMNLMSIEGVRCLMKRCGFEILNLSTPGELDVDIVRNSISENAEIGLSRFECQIINNSDEIIRLNFQNFLKDNYLSSHLRVLARPSKER